MKIKSILRLFALLFLAALPAHAQFLGYTSPQTVVTQNVFNSTDCSSGSIESAVLQNVGQSVHSVTYSVSGSITARVQIIASVDGVNYFSISDDGMGESSLFQGVLTGYGAFPFVRVGVDNGTAGCRVSAAYSGTSVSNTNPTGASDQSAYQKTVFNGASDGTTQSLSFVPPYGNLGGLLILSGSSAIPAGSSLQVEIVLASNAATFTFNLAAAAGAQTFVLPNIPASLVNVQYTSGGASANTFSLFYLFEKPGNLPIIPQCEKTAIINTAIAGPTQIIAPQGILNPNAAVRVCSLSVSSGTAEAVDFQQGTGTNCGTGNSQLTGLYHLAANTPGTQNFPVGGLVSLPGNAVCIHLIGANQTDGTITYSQY